MAKTNASLNNELRERYLTRLMEMLGSDEPDGTKGEEVMQIGSNEMCFPVVDSDGNEKWIQIVVKVPTWGMHEEDEGDDGYARAEEYRLKQLEKKHKAEKNAKEKAAKIQRDKENYARKKAEREALKTRIEG